MGTASPMLEPMPPQAVVVQMVMGAWVSKVISDVTRLNVPDVVQAHGPLTALELVSKYGVEARPDFLERALRACASLGIFTEDARGKFGPTPMSEVLTSGSSASVKKLVESVGGTWWKVWTGVYDAIKTGEPQCRNQLGMEFWDYLGANPKEMEDFGEAMKANSLSSLRGVLENCDFTDVSRVVDVGGGFGHMAVALLKKYPSLQAVVLDVPNLIPIAKKSLPSEDAAVAARLEYVGADMFDSVPRADAYILKHIIHDWDDARCIRLLQNCHRSMEENGRVICVDVVLPPMGDTSGTAGKLLDIDMMVFIPGKERTQAQWEHLYRTAGFRIESITPLLDNFGTSIVQGVKT